MNRALKIIKDLRDSYDLYNVHMTPSEIAENRGFSLAVARIGSALCMPGIMLKYLRNEIENLRK